MKNKKVLAAAAGALIAVLVLVLLLIPRGVKITAVKLPSSQTMTKGGTLTLTPTFETDKTAAPEQLDKAVQKAGFTWQSSAPQTATVDDAGLVTAVSGGKAVITYMAADGSVKAETELSVNVPVEKKPDNTKKEANTADQDSGKDAASQGKSSGAQANTKPQDKGGAAQSGGKDTAPQQGGNNAAAQGSTPAAPAPAPAPAPQPDPVPPAPAPAPAPQPEPVPPAPEPAPQPEDSGHHHVSPPVEFDPNAGNDVTLPED